MKIIGHSAKFQEVLRTIQLVSVTEVPVLLIGETGTGKKAIASDIHQQSLRKSQNFVKVNCSALPEEAAENMLFGCKKMISHVSEESKKRCVGYFNKAKNGTILLEDISALSDKLQIKLLHFIETSEVQAIGETIPHKVDARLIVTTHKDLHEEVSAGNFRADLYYRLNIIPVEIPTLSERESDIKILMEFFFRKLVKEQQRTAPSFTKAAIKQITQYEWPGNVRELKNFCERMFILSGGKEVDVTNLPQELRSFTNTKVDPASPFSLPSTGIQLEKVEVDLIQQALQTSNGNKSRAARLLGLTRDTFLYRLKKYSIDI